MPADLLVCDSCGELGVPRRLMPGQTERVCFLCDEVQEDEPMRVGWDESD